MYNILALVKDSQDVVKKIRFEKTLETQRVRCELELPDPVPEEFVQYESLTVETIENWLNAHKEMPSIDDLLQRKVEATQLTTDEDFPWGSAE